MLRRDQPPFTNLRNFLSHLENGGRLIRVREPISVVHEMTEIHRRVLQAGGPALMFEAAIKADGTTAEMPVLVNLFGTRERIAWGLGVNPERLAALGEALAELSEPRPPRDFADAIAKLPLARAIMAMRPKQVDTPPVQDIVWRGESIDLMRLPAQICWPQEPAPLITWPMVITGPPDDEAGNNANVGVYRMQVIGRDRAILRWLAHRGAPAIIINGRHADSTCRLRSQLVPIPQRFSQQFFPCRKHFLNSASPASFAVRVFRSHVASASR